MMTTPDASTPGPKPMETLLGHTDLTVTLLDGSTEQVQVRQLPIREYPAYLAAQLDEAAMVEMICAKPAGWADTLTHESIESIVTEGDRMNADFFGRWLQRRIARQERLLPGSLLVQGNAVEHSPTTPPTCASPAAGP